MVSSTAKGYPELCAGVTVNSATHIWTARYDRDGVYSLSDILLAQLKSLQPAVRCMFSQIEAFMKLLLTMLFSNADAERSFSYFQRMKT